MAAVLPHLLSRRTVISCRWDTGGDGHRRIMADSLGRTAEAGSCSCMLQLNRQTTSPPQVHITATPLGTRVGLDRAPRVMCDMPPPHKNVPVLALFAAPPALQSCPPSLLLGGPPVPCVQTPFPTAVALVKDAVPKPLRHLTSLALRRQGMSSVHASVFRALPALTALDLSHNALEALSPEVCELHPTSAAVYSPLPPGTPVRARAPQTYIA